MRNFNAKVREDKPQNIIGLGIRNESGDDSYNSVKKKISTLQTHGSNNTHVDYIFGNLQSITYRI